MWLRRFFFVMLLLAVGRAQAAPLAIVVDSAGAELSIVDMTSKRELRRIPVLREPHHVALSPNGQDLLLGDAGGNQMLFLDPASGEIKRRMTLADPYQLGFSPDGKFLVVNGLARDQVDVYSATDMKLVRRFPIASMPSHLDFSPDSRIVYVSLQGTASVVAFDLTRMEKLWTSQVGPSPAGVMMLHGRLLVAVMGSDYVAVLNPADGKVERRIHAGRGAHQLFLSPDKRVLYVNSRVDGLTTALDANTLAFQRNYQIPGGPDCIAFAPNGDLWITQRWAQKVAVLDPRTGDFQSIPVGRSPHGIFLTTDRR